MVSQSNNFQSQISSAADDRRHRIDAFKDRVAALRATSKTYHVVDNGSINTLDSSTVASSVTADSSYGGAKGRGARGAPLSATELLASRSPKSPEKRSPVEERQVHASDRRTAVELSSHVPNPFLDSDSDVSSGEDFTIDSSLDEDDGKASFENAAGAFRKKDPATKAEEEPARTPAEVEKNQEKKPPVTTTGRPGLARRASSGGAASGIGSSAGTISTMGGFSIESVQESTGGDGKSGAKDGNGMLRTWSRDDDGEALDIAEKADALIQRTKREAANETKPPSSAPAAATTNNPFEEDDSEEDAAPTNEWTNPFEEMIDEIKRSSSPVEDKPSNPFEEESEASSGEWKNPFAEKVKNKPSPSGNSNPFEDDSEGYSDSSQRKPSLSTSNKNPFEDNSEASSANSPKPFVKTAPAYVRTVQEGSKISFEKSPNPFFVESPTEEDDLTEEDLQRKSAASEKLEGILNEGWNLLADGSRSSTPVVQSYDLGKSSANIGVEDAAAKSSERATNYLPKNIQRKESESTTDDDVFLADSVSSIESSKGNGPASKWLASKVTRSRTALPQNIQRNESESTTDILLAGSSIASSKNDASSKPSPSTNPFAELLRLRQVRKMEMQKLIARSVGSMNMESSSAGGASLSSVEEEDLKKRVFFCDDDNNGSLDGALFSDLKQQLSKIQSVSVEEEDTEGEEARRAEDERRWEEVARMAVHDRPSDMKSHLVLKKETESCGVSSLKDSLPFGVGNEAKFDLFADEDDDSSAVMSVPKSPAPLETGIPGDRSEEVMATAESKDGGDSVTVTCSNSKKSDKVTGRERETTLTPPKKGVVLNDGSISTKDSILGRTINVANKDLAAERIYLESLRAQVLAELKVHVADEEIRLALDARLRAIQDYYKRKATVVHLQPVSETKPKLDGIFLDSLGDLPKVKPTVIAQSTSLEEHAAAMGGYEGPDTPASDVLQQRKDTHRFAFERVQGKIDEAIRAAHKTSHKESPREEEEEKRLEEDEDPAFNRQASETPIPIHIFTKDTFWDDEDDPGQISPTTPGSQPQGIERPIPPTRMDTIQNAWNFYCTVNALIFDSRVYDYAFQSQIQEDPLYPYLNSLMGIADSGEDGYSNEHKRISQKVKKDYADMSPHRICHALAKEAKDALPGLKSVCSYIGNKLGMQTMAVGPMKKASEALLKCERKYGGDPLLVTDYCRASLFVKDIASLLALIEIVLSKYAAVVRRIKLSNMKSDHNPLVGGYRDIKINIDIEGHICEIQVHLISLWLIKEGSGYAHYERCCEHNVDVSTFDIGRTLSGLERDVLVDLTKVGERSLTKRYPITAVQQYNEDQIRDYFALANAYLCQGSPAKAEYILRRLVKLRSENSDFGPCHAETLVHMELLRKSLKCQHKYKSASAVKHQIGKARKMQRDRDQTEPSIDELCATNQCGAMEHVCDLILDPAKKERTEEKRKADAVEESRALWLKVRRSFFS